MNDTTATRPAWTDEDDDALFATIGRYLIIFQWIEGLLDQALLLAWGHENWSASQARLAGMTNEKKVDEVRKVIFTSPDFARVHTRPDWLKHVDEMVARLHAERRQRNAVVHSQYLYEFTKIGLPPMASLRIKSKGDAGFKQVDFSKAFQAELMKNLGQLAFDMNFLLVQLRHDYQAPVPAA